MSDRTLLTAVLVTAVVAAVAALTWRVIRLERQAQLERAVAQSCATVAQSCATTDAEFFALVDRLWPDHP